MGKQIVQRYSVMKEDLTKCCTALLERVGVPGEEAEYIAEGVVLADLRGVGSHGIIRMRQYLQSFTDGGIRKAAKWRIIQEAPASLSLDACGSSGFVIGKKVMEWLMEKASVSGTAVASVKNATHFGMAACYAMMPMQHGMIGVAICNTAPYMAPWGGSAAFFGTNPIAIGIPAGEQLSVVLDMATTVAARGKIILAEKEGQTLPEGWAQNQRGMMTTDPAEALQGTLLPVGGPKGYGLALAVDVLSGLLSGGAYGPYVGHSTRTDVPQKSAQCFMVIDIQKFQPLEQFLANMDTLIREVKSSRRAEGVEEIYLPGELEFNLTRQRLVEGIPLSEELYAMLGELCRTYDVEMPIFQTTMWDAVTI